MQQVLDPTTLDLTDPEFYNIVNDTFEFNKDGKQVKCTGDKVKCVDWFKNEIEEQVNAASPARFNFSDGDNHAEGTMYFMN